MRAFQLAERIVRIAEQFPDRVAVWLGNVEWSYSDLIISARMIAEELGAESDQGSVVTVWSAKSFEAIAAVVGCGLAGRSVLLPSPQMDRTVVDGLRNVTGSQLLVRVSGSAAAGRVPLTIERSEWPAHGAGRWESAPLVLTTSGSTGTPKVVPLNAAGVDSFVDWVAVTFEIRPGTPVLSYAPLNFDVSLLDVWTTLCMGGSVVLIDGDRATDPGHVVDVLSSRNVAVMQVVPMVVRLLSRPDSPSFPSVEHLILTGEALQPALLPSIRRLFPQARVYNVYGCTETNDSFLHEIESFDPDGPPVPIGRPIDGVEGYLLDPDTGQRIDGPGSGELVVSTPFQCDGYLDEDLTAERFVTEGSSGGTSRRFFRTGDIVRRDADGLCHLQGRDDFHVKVRGVRTNLQEVEHVLLSHPDVREAAVVAVPDDVAGNRIHAVVHPRQATRLNSLMLRQHAATALPRTAIPSSVEFRHNPLPKTPTGKIDRSLIHP